jgi:hypothetical protein
VIEAYDWPQLGAPDLERVKAIYQDMMGQVKRARARGLRPARDYEIQTETPDHRYAGTLGISFVEIERRGDLLDAAEIETLVRATAVRRERHERQRRQSQQIQEILDAHLLRHQEDPERVPFPVAWRGQPIDESLLP